jgi:hypothetical protein
MYENVTTKPSVFQKLGCIDLKKWVYKNSEGGSDTINIYGATIVCHTLL